MNTWRKKTTTRNQSYNGYGKVLETVREAPELMDTLSKKFNNFRYFGYHTIA